MSRQWSEMSPAEKAATTRGRHRIRLLDGKYVCSKRFCKFRGTYEEGVVHMREAQREAA